MYLTIIVAIHAENEGDLVIYKVLYDENKGGAETLSMFM